MNPKSTGFVVDGLRRLFSTPEYRQRREVVATQVRAEHAAELAAASTYWERVAVEEKINRQIKEKLDAITPSPYSLWISSRLLS